LIEEGWMRKIPSKSTFHAVWRAIDKRLLEQWITLSGRGITSRREVKALAADSSGLNSIQESSSLFVTLTKML